MKKIDDSSDKLSKPLKKKRVLKYCVVIVVILILSLFITNGLSIIKYSNNDETRHADVAIVLGAGVIEGEPSPVFRERINHGIWLYEEGYVEKIILTGGYSEKSTASDAKIAMDYALSKGVPVENILYEENSAITQENLSYAKKVMEQNEYETALIVSDPLHMKRAMLLAKDMDIKSYSSATRTSEYKSWNTKLPFLAREVFFYIGYKITRVFY